MSVPLPRTLKTVAGVSGDPGIYGLAIDPEKSTMDTAVTVARRAEDAKIDALFAADLLTFGAQGAIGAQEPLIFMSALSQVTRNIGLIVTVSTTFHHPFNLARLFGTLDHVSNGRSAWNAVTSAIGEENFGLADMPSPEERYARAAESLEVVNALWDSWQDGALRTGPTGDVILDPSKVIPIDHHGKYFTVRGPLNIPPLPQGRPVQIQAGQSEGGVSLGARFAEVVFTSLPTLEAARNLTTKIRKKAAAQGRPAGLPLIFSSFHATYGATEEEARRKVREKREAIDFEHGRTQVADMLGGGVDLSEAQLDEKLPETLLPRLDSVRRRRGRVEIFSEYARQGYTLRELIVAAQDTGHWAAAGTPEQLADQVEQRFRAGVLDVITLGGLSSARQHDFAVNGLLHELRKRKIVKFDYAGPTLRENLALPFPRDR